MKINFVKLTDKWFADIVNWVGSVMDLEMVNGADTFLDKISEGKRYISLNVSDNPIENGYRFECVNCDSDGADYFCEETGDTIWLCPVTVTVFSEFPQNIWFKKIPIVL